MMMKHSSQLPHVDKSHPVESYTLGRQAAGTTDVEMRGNNDANSMFSGGSSKKTADTSLKSNTENKDGSE